MSDVDYVYVEEFDDDDDYESEIRNARRRAGRSQLPPSRGRRYKIPIRRESHQPGAHWPYRPHNLPYPPPASNRPPVLIPPSTPTPGPQTVFAPPMVGKKRKRGVKIEKIADGIELTSDGVAALWPLPDQPPAPTGNEKIDIANQNEHRHAVASHQRLTSRIRTAGRVAGGLLKLFFGDDDHSER